MSGKPLKMNWQQQCTPARVAGQVSIRVAEPVSIQVVVPKKIQAAPGIVADKTDS